MSELTHPRSTCPQGMGTNEDDSTSSRSREARWAERLTCLVLSTILSLLIAEIAVRAWSDRFDTGYQPSSNVKLVYELNPGHPIGRLKASISSQGLNDREFTIEKPAGVFRIAVVGDSTSFGWKVGSDHSLPKVLERELNLLGTRRFEVMNFSVPGYNTAQELEVIRVKVLPFQPDLVILVFTGNDTHVCNYLLPDPTLLGALAHRSYLLNLTLRTIEEQLARRDGENFAFPLWWIRFKWLTLRVAYPRQKIYPRPGLEETIYVGGNPPAERGRVPERYWYMLGYPNYRVHLTAIRDLLAKESIPLVSTGQLTAEALEINRKLDLTHIVTGLWPEELARDFGTDEPLVIPNDGHYSAAGHELAARRIMNYLMEHHLV